MSDFVERFDARGDAMKTAYVSEESKPNRPAGNPLVNILVDVMHRCAMNGVDYDELSGKAVEVFEYEDYFVSGILKDHAAEKAAARLQVAS